MSKRLCVIAVLPVAVALILAGCGESSKPPAPQVVGSGTQAPASGPPLPDLAIASIDIAYSYQYPGKEPVVFTAPFKGNVRTDINWVPLNPLPQKYSSNAVFTVRNAGNAAWPSGERALMLVDVGGKRWTHFYIDSPAGGLKPGEAIKHQISASDIWFDLSSRNYLFTLETPLKEISKENNTHAVAVTFVFQPRS